MRQDEIRKLVLKSFYENARTASGNLSLLAERDLLDTEEAKRQERNLENAVAMYLTFKNKFEKEKGDGWFEF